MSDKQKRIKPFTAAELAKVRQPDVEDRLNTVEQTLSMLTLLTRAVSQTDDLALTADMAQPGWSMVSDLCAEALADLWATRAALPADATFTKAPRKAGA